MQTIDHTFVQVGMVGVMLNRNNTNTDQQVYVQVADSVLRITVRLVIPAAHASSSLPWRQCHPAQFR